MDDLRKYHIPAMGVYQTKHDEFRMNIYMKFKKDQRNIVKKIHNKYDEKERTINNP